MSEVLALILGILLGALLVLVGVLSTRGRLGGACDAPSSPSSSSLNLGLSAVSGRSQVMPTTERPPIEFVDVEKVTLSVAPKDADGRLVRDKTVSWSVVDQAADDGSTDDVLTLEVAEDTLSAVALSGTPGTCVIEVRYDDPATDDDPVERMAIRIKTGEVSTLNLSAGAPVPE